MQKAVAPAAPPTVKGGHSSSGGDSTALQEAGSKKDKVERRVVEKMGKMSFAAAVGADSRSNASTKGKTQPSGPVVLLARPVETNAKSGQGRPPVAGPKAAVSTAPEAGNLPPPPADWQTQAVPAASASQAATAPQVRNIFASTASKIVIDSIDSMQLVLGYVLLRLMRPQLGSHRR